MWQLAIAFTVMIGGHAHVQTRVLEYPTSFTCNAAVERLDPGQLLSIARHAERSRRPRQHTTKVHVPECRPAGPQGEDDGIFYTAPNRTLDL